MTEREYRQSEGISRSELWLLNPDNGGTPEKFKWAREHPEKPTPTLIFGTLVHCLLLEPDAFNKQFSVWDDAVKKTTKEGKAAYAEFTDDLMGRQEISRTMYEQAVEMVLKLRSTPFVGKLLVGEHEKPFFWTDADTGEKCKCRVDCILHEDGEDVPTIVDYKTAANASTGVFNSEIYKRGYHVQAAMYAEGVKTALNLPELPKFKFIVQEKNAPYAVNIVAVPSEVMTFGTDVFRDLLGIYHDCKLTDYWYGYNGAFDLENEAYLPGWLQMGVEENDD